MVTSIQISEELKNTLKKRKFYPNETYEDIIWDLIEDSLELDKETKEAIEQARIEYEKGETISHEQMKEELGI